jgi:hypothetical protein
VLEKQLAEARDQRRQMTKETVEQLQKAVELYHGDFLEGFYIRGSEGFDNWMVLERERVRAIHEQSMQLLLDGLLSVQRWSDAVEWGERWISQGQYPEPAYRVLMNAYCGLGDMATVSAVYQRCVETLGSELGIDPSEQTRETYERILRGEGPSAQLWVQPAEPEAPAADSAARLLLRQWRTRREDVLDVASLAVIYASRGDLGLGPGEAGLLIRSALHHGVDVHPWLRRAGSPDEAAGALRDVMQTYPRPAIRTRIVEALQSLEGDAAANTLVEVALSDDAPKVREAAALAAAGKGRLDEVATGLVAEMEAGSEAAPLEALVALEDEYGLPKDTGPYPKLPVAFALARRRWRAQHSLIRRQAFRAGLGGAIAWALFAMLLPVYYSLAYPEEFGETSGDLVSLPMWMIINGISGLVVGGLLGMASGSAVGIADALRRGPSRVRWRLMMGSLAGSVYAGYLITFCLIGAFSPSASAGMFIPVYVLYGFLQGLVLTFVIPPLGSPSPPRQQLIRSAVVGVASALLTVPCVLLLYDIQDPFELTTRMIQAFLLPLGMGLALSSHARRTVRVDLGEKSEVRTVA